jgi:hypothetical protein
MKAFLVCLLASIPILGLLVTWAILYPLDQIAVYAVLIAAGSSIAILYKCNLARRRALASAVLLPSTPLYPFFAGRLGAAMSSIVTTLVVMPPIAFFTLTSGPLGWVAVSLLLFFTCILSAIVDLLVSKHTQSAYTPAITSGSVAILASILVIPAHSLASYYLSVMPAWIDESSFIAMLAAARGTLPHLGSATSEVLSVFLIGDVLGYWFIKLSGGNSLPLIMLILLRDSLIFYGLALTFAGFQAVALSSLRASDRSRISKRIQDV